MSASAVELFPTMRSISDDGALADAFAAKAPWAFDEAYARFGRLLYSTAYHVLENQEDAQDCVQDALARVWRLPDSYTRARGALRSFLTVCVRNEAITRIRSRIRRHRMEERIAAEPQTPGELGAVDVIERDKLQAALRALPEEQRKPLELAYFHYKTHVEIAEELHEPLGTIKSRIALGLRKLGTALGSRA